MKNTQSQKTNTNASSSVLIKPVQQHFLRLWIRGTAPLIQHAWSEKGIRCLRMTAAERKKLPKGPRDPDTEGNAATYRTPEGDYGIPAMAVKAAMIEVAHKDVGLPKTTVRKALRFDRNGILPMDCDEPEIREDIVRVGNEQTDLRYRPEFGRWTVRIELRYDAELLTVQDVVNLIDRAGFSVGIGEWRPEKNGEYGTFEVDRTRPIDSGPLGQDNVE